MPSLRWDGLLVDGEAYVWTDAPGVGNILRLCISQLYASTAPRTNLKARNRPASTPVNHMLPRGNSRENDKIYIFFPSFPLPSSPSSERRNPSSLYPKPSGSLSLNLFHYPEVIFLIVPSPRFFFYKIGEYLLCMLGSADLSHALFHVFIGILSRFLKALVSVTGAFFLFFVFFPPDSHTFDSQLFWFKWFTLN